MSKSDTVEFKGVRAVGATDKGIWVKGIEERDQFVYQGAIHDDSEVWRDGDEGTLVVKEWWAQKKGWI